jgi:hypothetical protein
MRHNLIYVILLIVFLLIIYFYFLENETCYGYPNMSDKNPVSNICYSTDTTVNYYCITGDDDPYYCTTGSKINIKWTLPEYTPGVPPRTLTYTLNFIKNPVTENPATENPICSYDVESTVSEINVIFRKDDDSSANVCYISSDNSTIIVPGEINDKVYFNIVTNIAEYDIDENKSDPIGGPVFTIVECLTDSEGGDNCGFDRSCLNNKCRLVTTDMPPIILPGGYLWFINNDIARYSNCIKYIPTEPSDLINISSGILTPASHCTGDCSSYMIGVSIVVFVKLDNNTKNSPDSIFLKMIIKDAATNATKLTVILVPVGTTYEIDDSPPDYIYANYTDYGFSDNNIIKRKYNIYKYYINLQNIIYDDIKAGEYTITVNTIYKTPEPEPQMLEYDYPPREQKDSSSYNISPDSEKLILNLYNYHTDVIPNVSNIYITYDDIKYTITDHAACVLTSDTITISWDHPGKYSNGVNYAQFNYNLLFYNDSHTASTLTDDPLCILDYYDTSIILSFDKSITAGRIFNRTKEENTFNIPFDVGKVWFTVRERLRYSTNSPITEIHGPDFYLIDPTQ